MYGSMSAVMIEHEVKHRSKIDEDEDDDDDKVRLKMIR